ncbi:MAG: helix-turn-helix transcriptional regulator, partial [Gemmatimonadota bacterium]
HGMYRGETTARDVAGYGMLFRRGHWYLIGEDRLRDAIRTFRVERMEAVKLNSKSPRSPDYDVPDDFHLAAWRGREAWELGDEPPVAGRVRFSFPRSLWAARNGQGELIEDEPEGAAVREFAVQQVDPFLRWVLAQEGEAEVVGPPELRAAYATLVGEVTALYRRDA